MDEPTMNADLTAIIADESKRHAVRGGANPYLAQCVCNGWAGRPDDFEDHRAEQIAARLGIEEPEWYAAHQKLYRVKALESQ